MQGKQWTADRRIYLDGQGRAVEANDPNRATLLVAEGRTIPMTQAIELGLVGDQGKVVVDGVTVESELGQVAEIATSGEVALAVDLTQYVPIEDFNAVKAENETLRAELDALKAEKTEKADETGDEKADDPANDKADTPAADKAETPKDDKAEAPANDKAEKPAKNKADKA